MARDPLSVRYDGLTAGLLGDALARQGRWIVRAVPRPAFRSSASRGWLAEHGIDLDAVDSGGLTSYQRSYQRSLYHQAKELGISAGPESSLSLQREWGPETRHGRLLSVRISTRTAAVRAVRRKPAAVRYTENPALKSAGRGGPAQRFP